MAKLLYADCVKMTRFILGEAEKQKRPLGLSITDDAGRMVSCALMDGGPQRFIDLTYRKCYTAAKLTRSGAEVKQLLESSNITIQDFGDPLFIPFIGSALVRKDGEIVGAIAVSGWTSEEDQELCDRAAALVQ